MTPKREAVSSQRMPAAYRVCLITEYDVCKFSYSPVKRQKAQYAIFLRAKYLEIMRAQAGVTCVVVWKYRFSHACVYELRHPIRKRFCVIIHHIWYFEKIT